MVDDFTPEQMIGKPETIRKSSIRKKATGKKAAGNKAVKKKSAAS
jgi:hypothetical protein